MNRNIIAVVLILNILLGCEQDDTLNKETVLIEVIQVNKKGNEYQPNETSITINPKNPLHMVAAANRKFYYSSFDGGKSWNQNTLYTTLGVRGDPCVKFDLGGNVYYSHLAEVDGEMIADRMVVQKSVDGGLTWNDGIGFEKNGKQHDREWMVVDLTESIHQNNIYVTWTQYDEYGNSNDSYKSTVLCSVSKNGGESFSEAVAISDVLGDCSDDDNSLQGAKPTIGPNGELYVCWSGLNKIFFDKSLDGGKTFQNDVQVTEQIGGWSFDIPGISRADGCPSIACDISNSIYRGNIYVVWSDLRNGENNSDVFLKKSNDRGNTWSDIIRVNNDDSNRHQFFPCISIDPITGYIYIAFYDRRETLGDYTYVYLARSIDGGNTFNNIKITEDSFNPKGNFIGDYIDIVSFNNNVYPIWTKTTEYGRDIMMAIVEF